MQEEYVKIIDQPWTHQIHFFFKLAVRPRGPPGLKREYLKERVEFKGILCITDIQVKIRSGERLGKWKWCPRRRSWCDRLDKSSLQRRTRMILYLDDTQMIRGWYLDDTRMILYLEGFPSELTIASSSFPPPQEWNRASSLSGWELSLWYDSAFNYTQSLPQELFLSSPAPRPSPLSASSEGSPPPPAWPFFIGFKGQLFAVCCNSKILSKAWHNLFPELNFTSWRAPGRA